MKTESLEALLLDRALGELPAETAELLEAHLAQNPDAAVRAASWDVTVAHTQGALAAGEAADVAAPDLARIQDLLRQQEQRQRWLRRVRASTRMAAAVAAGIALGWLWFGRPTSTIVPSPHTVAALHEETTVPQNAAQRFWSRDNFLGRSRLPAGEPTSSEGRPPWRWVSPPTSSQGKAGS